MKLNLDNVHKCYKDKMLATYKNGNYDVILLNNGTKIRYNDETNFVPEHFESADVKITNRCVHNCPFCHENSCPEGQHADLNQYRELLDSIHPYTELAIGGGNPLLHPQLDEFLQYCKARQLIPSMTVHWKDFIQQYERILNYSKEGLLYGIGVSMPTVDIEDENRKNLYACIQDTPNTVCHFILGIHTLLQLLEVSNLVDSPKVLFLGYKTFRRGANYINEIRTHYTSILNNINDVRNYMFLMKQKRVRDLHFDTIAFDNLALQQLQMYSAKERCSPFYMGDEGEFTLFLDLVAGEFAVSSTSKNRFPIANKNADEIFTEVRNHRAE